MEPEMEPEMEIGRLGAKRPFHETAASGIRDRNSNGAVLDDAAVGPSFSVRTTFVTSRAAMRPTPWGKPDAGPRAMVAARFQMGRQP